MIILSLNRACFDAVATVCMYASKVIVFFPSLCVFVRMMKMTAARREERTSVQWKLDSVIGVASTLPIPS